MSLLIKHLSRFLDIWWKPILFWIISVLLLIIANIINNPLLENVCFAIFFLGLLGLLISAFNQLSQKNWLKTILTFSLFGGTIFVGIILLVTLFFIDQETSDSWAKNLKIPKNIQIENPVDMEFGINQNEKKPDSITNKTIKKTEFQLYNSFQPGLYEYDFWIGKIESGTIYLKAFEITQHVALSTDRLPKRSAIKVYNPTDRIIKFGTTDNFTIYEGDWGQPYAARFEIWFKPDNGKKERKLFSKNYKIEGWMR